MQRKPVDTQFAPPNEGKCLNLREIAIIEAAFKKVGTFGEVHLVIERGRLRFVRTVKSETVDEIRVDNR